MSYKCIIVDPPYNVKATMARNWREALSKRYSSIADALSAPVNYEVRVTTPVERHAMMPVFEIKKHKCHCSRQQLMRGGCVCGGI